MKARALLAAIARLYAPGVCLGFGAGVATDRLALTHRPDGLVLALALIVALGAIFAVLSERPGR